jgi:hypothetical protein
MAAVAMMASRLNVETGAWVDREVRAHAQDLRQWAKVVSFSLPGHW